MENFGLICFYIYCLQSNIWYCQPVDICIHLYVTFLTLIVYKLNVTVHQWHWSGMRNLVNLIPYYLFRSYTYQKQRVNREEVLECNYLF